jgi:hypothetical protein
VIQASAVPMLRDFVAYPRERASIRRRRHLDALPAEYGAAVLLRSRRGMNAVARRCGQRPSAIEMTRAVPLTAGMASRLLTTRDHDGNLRGVECFLSVFVAHAHDGQLAGVSMKKTFQTAALLVLAVASSASSAQADTVALTSGFVDAVNMSGGGNGPVELVGDRGFTLTAIVDAAGFFAAASCPCLPGAPLSIDGNWIGVDLRGTTVGVGPVVTLDGATYTHVGELTSPSDSVLQVDGSLVLPSIVSASAVVTAPFQLDYFFSPDGGLFPMTQFSGSGIATVSLADEPFVNDGQAWRVTRVRYDLTSPSAVPEPSTVLLLSTGLVWATARRRLVNLGRSRH